MSDEAFEKIVRQTLNNLPDNFKNQLENVEIVIAKEPDDPRLLGLYQGVPKTERGFYSSLPDKITIYKNPLLQMSQSPEDAEENIRKTVLHEIGHHFGLSDEQLSHLKQLL